MKRISEMLNAELEKRIKRRDVYRLQQAAFAILEENLTKSIQILLFLIQFIKEQEERLTAKKIIHPQEIAPFFEKASRLYDALQQRLHTPLNYSWFCIWLSARYSIRRQKGGAPDSELSPWTILSYFKRERTNDHPDNSEKSPKQDTTTGNHQDSCPKK